MPSLHQRAKRLKTLFHEPKLLGEHPPLGATTKHPQHCFDKPATARWLQ